jgi:peptidoglycan/xylan/chitin deacetylase (PgdA/CDA1 family)
MQLISAPSGRSNNEGSLKSRAPCRRVQEQEMTMQSKRATWPNGKRIAVSVTVMFEAWSEDAAPSYSVQATALKKGVVDHAAKAWSTYGGRVGVWRLVRLLDRYRVPGTFFVNARCTELYPDAVRQIARSGHDIAGHSYTHDQILAYMSLEEQQATIRRSVDMLEGCTGKKVSGWGSPAVAFTPETAGFLAQAGLTWTTDVTYVDLPHRIVTPYGDIAGVPTTDFSDNRVLKANTRDLYDVYKGTFDYLYEHEPMSLMVMVLHCQFGGRPLVSAVVDQILKYVSGHDDVWFTNHAELARWALDQPQAEHTYASRFFADSVARVAAAV